ncbi:MAG: acetoin utilization protein AcuC [Actinobacteria bacterium]|nr:acetoin utilization protein AcuC [Actinomycetota bacterium]
MSDSLTVVWDDALKAYDFGPGHPLAPIRVQLAMRLATDFDLLTGPRVSVHSPVLPATAEDLLRVHDADYIAAVERASLDVRAVDEARGLGTSDDPVFAGMHAASALVGGATLAAARVVQSGSAQHAINIAGGLHHAMPDRASGFCIYNDIGLAIAWLLAQGYWRIAYIDVDVHHGDGVQAMFYDDPRVLTISVHEDPRTLFPGTGFPDEVGGPGALGTAVNIALPAGTGDQGWLRAFHAIVPDVLEAFNPQIIVSQHGCDSHFEDPLAHLTLSIDGQRMSYEAIHRWAHRFADGRWIAVGGGGYEWVNVVPRAWAHLIAEAAGNPISAKSQTPESFRTYVSESLGRPGPAHMTDGRQPWAKPFDQGCDPADPVDSAILATRSAVYPHLGLEADQDPWL